MTDPTCSPRIVFTGQISYQSLNAKANLLQIPLKHHTPRPAQHGCCISLPRCTDQVHTAMLSILPRELEDNERFVEVVEVICRSSDRSVDIAMCHV